MSWLNGKRILGEFKKTFSTLEPSGSVGSAGYETTSYVSGSREGVLVPEVSEVSAGVRGTEVEGDGILFLYDVLPEGSFVKHEGQYWRIISDAISHPQRNVYEMEVRIDDDAPPT